jgi:hypothetical protein
MGQNDVTIVNNRASFRLSVIEAVRQAADELAQPLEQGSIVGPDLAGIPILSRGVLGEVLNRVKASPLPAIDLTSAEVKTPADVYVDVICPECELPTRILVQLTAVLETTREAGSSIKLKAKAKAKTHVHHQLSLEVDDGQGELGLDGGDEVDVEDDTDLRPTGEVNVDELHGEAQRSVEAAENERKTGRLRMLPLKPTPALDEADDALLPD